MKIQKRTMIKVATWSGAGLLALTALVGFAHTPAGRPLLALLGAAPGCPVLANVDPIKAQENRQAWVAKKAGNQPAPAHPALDFELGRTLQPEVTQSLAKQGTTCSLTRKGTALECTGGQENMVLQFDGTQRLVAVDVFHHPRTSESALVLLNDAERGLTAKLGQATHERGERSASYLGEQRFRQVALEYRYSDYTARVAATNFGDGLRVREQYDLLTKPGG